MELGTDPDLPIDMQTKPSPQTGRRESAQDRPTPTPSEKRSAPVTSATLDLLAPAEVTPPLEVEAKQIAIELLDESDRLRLRLPPYRGIPELAESLKAKGQLAPLYVRPKGTRFELISGYRRLTALKQISAAAAFCRIFRGISDQRAYDIAITENEDEDDLSDLERAQICLRLQSEGQTADEIAARFGWSSRRNVYFHYRLANDASPAMRDALQQGGLSLHVALALIDAKAASLGDQKEREILKTVVEHEMSVREAKNHVLRIRRAVEAASGEPSTRVGYLRDHKNGAFTISARIDPQHPDDLDEAIASVELALKRMKQIKRKLEPKAEETKPTKPASPDRGA
jgi:ParB/RepB/Spo0J family partition protein